MIAVALATASSSFAEVTMRPVPLDCGGWVSGFSVTKTGRVYAYGDVFGLWRSDDSGKSWKYLLHDLTAYDHFGCGTAVPTTDQETILFLSNAKLFKSTDGGITWSVLLDRLATGLSRGSTPIVFQPGSTTEMWLAAPRRRETYGLWHTVDGGVTWNKAGGDIFDNVRVLTVCVRPEFPDQIWVGAIGGLFVSTDHGVTFTNVWDNAGARNPMGARPAVNSIARRSDGIVYFATNIAGFQLTATDYKDPKSYQINSVVTRVQGQGPSSATVLADDSFVTSELGGRYTRVSGDGTTWDDLPMILLEENTPVYLVPKPDAKVPGGRDMIVQDPTKPSRWFMTGGKAPFITEDAGTTWSYPPNGSGLAGVVVYGKIGFPGKDPQKAFIPAADQGVFVVNDGGATGKVAYCSRTSFDKHAIFQSTMYSEDGQTIVAAGCEQSGSTNLMYCSTNGGKDWEELDLTNSGLPPSAEGIQRSVAAPGSTTDFLVLLGYKNDPKNNNPGMYRTKDGGVSFTKVTGIPDGIDTGHRYDPSLSHLETDGVKKDNRYLALRSPNNESARGVYRSTDGGSTWAKTSGEPFGKAWITEMAADSSVAERLWVTGKGKGLSRSDDGGDNWTAVGDFIDTAHVSAVKGCVAVWGKRPGDEWTKLYYSADNGASWQEVTGPGRRLPFLLNVTINPHKTNELWVSGISVNILTIDGAAAKAAVDASKVSGGTALATATN
jgi:photosystem II stability/assembly factor-like uncharacterized protein